MKENVLDVLVYLFEHFIYDEPENARDRTSIEADLAHAGFGAPEIGKAFEWLDELERRRPEGSAIAANGPVRVYAPLELERLDAECRGFLLYLEQELVLDVSLRELVIDRVMALEDDELDLEDLKWVVLMVMFNQPGQEAAYAWMESHLLESVGEAVH